LIDGWTNAPITLASSDPVCHASPRKLAEASPSES
jgi:hypothetical protein